MPDPTGQNKKPTAAAEWRKPAEGFVLDLPSGKAIKVRRTLDMFELLKSGEIPNVLKGIMAEAMGGGDPKKVEANVMSELGKPENLTSMIEFVNETVIRMALEPRVAPMPKKMDNELDYEYMARIEEASPPDGFIWINDIDLEDRMFIFQVGQGGTTDLVKFREESGIGLAAVSDGHEVPVPAKRASRAGKSK